MHVRVDESVAMARELLASCRTRHLSLATAESCTGGLVGATVSAVPGASDVFLGGVVSYANAVKMKVLGVREDTLTQFGAVSEACAREMVLGACRALGAQVALATTGIAGPGGGSAEKPVGLVFTAVAVEGRVVVCRNVFDGSREEIRSAAVSQVLTMARDALV